MRNFFITFWLGVKEPFKSPNYTALFVVMFLLMFALFVLIPVWAVSGNTIAYQLKIFIARDYAVLILLSGLSSLFITMQVFVMKSRKKVAGLSGTVGGGLSALFAGIVGTAFCASCLAPLFAIFGIGFGGVVFVLDYRWYFVVGITALMLIAIYLMARKINKVCTSC